ncbi:sirohydrochlorin chelatase [Pseudothauera rhizosphaerae]|nr:CbiX/SirB N-terminal domain-containing protein [Pseudothauera rhizosphaerae]
MGILLLAHGSHAPGGHGHGDHAGHGPANVWNANVEQVARSLDERLPTEVAFGMADPQAIQAAVERLERRGVREIAAVPLFVSSHSPIIGNFRYILGLQAELAKTTRVRRLDRVASSARFHFAGAMDAHPLVSGILLERALAATDDAAATSVVVIAHGPNDEGENALWLRDMEAHARFLRERGGFRRVDVLTHRNDAPPPVKDAAREAFRRNVAEAGQGGPVVVVPLLLSAGGIEAEVEGDLAGLPYRFARPLMPHPNIGRWVETMAGSLLGQGSIGAE